MRASRLIAALALVAVPAAMSAQTRLDFVAAGAISNHSWGTSKAFSFGILGTVTASSLMDHWVYSKGLTTDPINNYEKGLGLSCRGPTAGNGYKAPGTGFSADKCAEADYEIGFNPYTHKGDTLFLDLTGLTGTATSIRLGSAQAGEWWQVLGSMTGSSWTTLGVGSNPTISGTAWAEIALAGQKYLKITSPYAGAGGDDILVNSIVVAGAVPEPATFALMGTGLIGIFAVSRRRKQA